MLEELTYLDQQICKSTTLIHNGGSFSSCINLIIEKQLAIIKKNDGTNVMSYNFNATFPVSIKCALRWKSEISPSSSVQQHIGSRR